jgi:hypothetical protein
MDSYIYPMNQNEKQFHCEALSSEWPISGHKSSMVDMIFSRVLSFKLALVRVE